MLGALAHQYRAHPGVRVEHVRLLEGGHPQAAAPGHPARVGPDPAGQHAQKRGFPLAVASDDADAVAVVDSEGDGVEHDLRRILEMQRLGAEQVCHWR